ncbi:MAG: hypothetical protein HKN82_05580, partial [Akkermansiaceae bacterium]|nr:hypothetical protein [Akkermansiaceae bacterium]
MTIRTGLIALVGFATVFPALDAGETEVPFSSLKARVVFGHREIPYEYTRRESKDASQLRIVNKRTALPTPPYNLIDLKTGEVTILYPQNSTYLRIPADRFERKHPAAPGIPRMPALPPGIGPRGTPGPAPTPSPSPPQGDNEIRPSPPRPEGVNLPEGVKLP